MATLRIFVLGFILTMVGYVHVQANIVAEDLFFMPTKELINLTESEGLDVQEWQLLARDIQGTVSDKQTFKQHVHNLTRELSDWNVNDPVVEGSEWTASTNLYHPEIGITESLQIFAYPSNGERVLSYSYKIKGESVTALRSEAVEQLLKKRIKDFSLQQTTVFTQLKTMMTSDLNGQTFYERASQLVSALGAVEIEELKEETFVSISAYNEKWEDTIVTNDKKMNLQVAIRQDVRLGSGTTVTIGTPIITTEY